MKEDPVKYIKPEFKIGEWLPIEYFQYIPNGVNAIHCDTRDFHMIMRNYKIEKDQYKDLYRLLHGAKINECFLIKRSEIMSWLKNIEEISGGKCKWRCLNFYTIKTKLGWLKYIRMYHYKDDYFVVCDGYAEPIDWRTMNEETLEKEYLNAH